MTEEMFDELLELIEAKIDEKITLALDNDALRESTYFTNLKEKFLENFCWDRRDEN